MTDRRGVRIVQRWMIVGAAGLVVLLMWAQVEATGVRMTIRLTAWLVSATALATLPAAAKMRMEAGWTENLWPWRWWLRKALPVGIVAALIVGATYAA